MIKLKNEKDIENIRKAIRIGETALDKIHKYVKPGITTLKLNNKLERMIRSKRAKPSFKNHKDFPCASCISVNKEVIHGIPNNRQLKEGDMVKIDVGVNYKGYYSDQARTYFVGKIISREHFKLAYATKTALDRVLRSVEMGDPISRIGKIIEKTAEDFGVGILKDFCGHGVGFAVHEEPKIPNRSSLYGSPVMLKKGMVLAIEPMFVLGEGDYRIHPNDWTVIADGISAHFEQTVVI